MALHTLLGANGTIATELVPVLLANKENIRLVSRNPKAVAGAETMAADVLNYQQVLKAVNGSDIVYLLVGLEYNIHVWRKSWPVIMRNVIEACKACKAKLVFFDNAYMYGRVDGKITEETPFKPISKKGALRAEIDQMLLDEMNAGRIKAAIAKAVDFYGPRCIDKSATGLMVFERMKNGKTAQWLGNANVPRSFNYTPDAAKALYMLATSEKAYGQTWHLPAVSPALTGKQFVDLAAKYMKAKNNVQVVPKWLLSVSGLFNRFMKEMNEMMCQNDYPFEFDSSKFQKAFAFTPTSYEQAIKETAEWFLDNG
ncbi:NAD-dependent epimerase/dehydratase family protein [Danxiaibacter flavus]|uniref:NAD-dependent epimerase/dehydratase family protein n=1 Tax=Danxiaibacter flavus TaxID=3049108 RepID=A0ABV3ZA76_9BACT|nr:NAD-dependent epimerase/dehydratase family protein [Chitinophagaceae bacterium DXS]